MITKWCELKLFKCLQVVKCTYYEGCLFTLDSDDNTLDYIFTGTVASTVLLHGSIQHLHRFRRLGYDLLFILGKFHNIMPSSVQDLKFESSVTPSITICQCPHSFIIFKQT